MIAAMARSSGRTFSILTATSGVKYPRYLRVHPLLNGEADTEKNYHLTSIIKLVLSSHSQPI